MNIGILLFYASQTYVYKHLNNVTPMLGELKEISLKLYSEITEKINLTDKNFLK